MQARPRLRKFEPPELEAQCQENAMLGAGSLCTGTQTSTRSATMRPFSWRAAYRIYLPYQSVTRPHCGTLPAELGTRWCRERARRSGKQHSL